MHPWVCFSLIILLTGTSIYFGLSAYRHGRKLVLVYLTMTVFMTFASSKSLAIILQVIGLDKAWKLNVNAAINASSWITEIGSVIMGILVISGFLFLHWSRSRTEDERELMEAGHQLFEDFQAVLTDNLTIGMEPRDIAEKRNIPLEKVNHIVMCYSWLEYGPSPHRNKANGTD